jgi:RNA polymerase sigma-70 factor (ECF subfamily)
LPASGEGDRLAMQTLFARHRTPVYRWLLRLVGNETLAEDLVSDVFLDVWRQASRFEGRSSVSTWLMAIARFKAISARRRRTDAELDDVVESTVADTADDPAVALEKKYRDEVLRTALPNCPPSTKRSSTSSTITRSRSTNARRSSGCPPAR